MGKQLREKIVITLMMTFSVISYSVANSQIVSAAMNSDSYKVPIDELGQVGGTSSSASYKIQHNLGEVVTGSMTSASYKLNSGYIQNDKPVLIFSLSGSSINFGTLSPSAVSTGSVTATISTSSLSGYSIQAYDDTSAGLANGLVVGAKKIADATTPNSYISLPSAGTEHYGIVVTGTHAASGYAAGTKTNSLDNTTWAEIGSHSDFITGDTLIVQYRASITQLSPAGADFQAITTFIVTGNF